MRRMLFFGIALLLWAGAAPTFANSTIGGIVFLDIYNFQKDKENNGGESITNGKLEVPSSSRLRARWTNEDRVTMYVELGIGGSEGSTGTKLRHAWGSWDFSEKWQIMGGHSSTPYSPIFPSQLIGNSSGEDHIIGWGYGDHNPGRVPQIRLTRKFLNRKGALAVALVNPNRGKKLSMDGQEIGERDTTLPRLDVGMAYKTFNLQLFPSFFYQTQTYQGLDAPGDDEVTAWGGSFGFKAGKGPFVFSGEANMGQNWGNSSGSLGSSPAAQGAGAAVHMISDRIVVTDTDNMAYWGDAGFKFTTESLRGTVHIIAGSMSSETDAVSGIGASDYTSTMMGVSIPIDMPWVARGFRVRPEIFFYDEGSNMVEGVEVDFGTEAIYGVQLQYTF